MRAITIRQPWAWAIVHAGKRVENRSWGTDYCGPVLIHAAKGMTRTEYELACSVIESIVGRYCVPPIEKLLRGGIVGRAQLVDHIHPGGLGMRGYPSARAARLRHRLADDPWYGGEHGLVMDDVEPTPFVECRGALGLWQPPDHVLEALRP